MKIKIFISGICLSVFLQAADIEPIDINRFTIQFSDDTSMDVDKRVLDLSPLLKAKIQGLNKVPFDELVGPGISKYTFKDAYKLMEIIQKTGDEKLAKEEASQFVSQLDVDRTKKLLPFLIKLGLRALTPIVAGHLRSFVEESKKERTVRVILLGGKEREADREVLKLSPVIRDMLSDLGEEVSEGIPLQNISLEAFENLYPLMGIVKRNLDKVSDQKDVQEKLNALNFEAVKALLVAAHYLDVPKDSIVDPIANRFVALVTPGALRDFVENPDDFMKKNNVSRDIMNELLVSVDIAKWVKSPARIIEGDEYNRMHTLVISNDAQLLIAGRSYNSIEAWDIFEGKSLFKKAYRAFNNDIPYDSKSRYRPIALSGDKSRFVIEFPVTNQGKTIFLCDSKTGNVIEELPLSVVPTELALSQDGSSVLITDENHYELICYDFLKKKERFHKTLDFGFTSMGFSRGGSWVFGVASEKKGLFTSSFKSLNSDDGSLINSWPMANLFNCKLSPDGKWVALICKGKAKSQIRNLSNPQIIIDIPDKDIDRFVFSPDGSRVAIVTNNTIVVRDMNTMRQVSSQLDAKNNIGLAISEDGSSLIGVSGDGMVSIWSLKENLPIGISLMLSVLSAENITISSKMINWEKIKVFAEQVLPHVKNKDTRDQLQKYIYDAVIRR